MYNARVGQKGRKLKLAAFLPFVNNFLKEKENAKIKKQKRY